MALHPKFPTSPYAPLIPEQRWFPADEALRSTAYEKLLPPIVAKVREEVHSWRDKAYAGASPTSVALLRHWFDTEHLTENADGSLSPLRYYFAQREAVETVTRIAPNTTGRSFTTLRLPGATAELPSVSMAKPVPWISIHPIGPPAIPTIASAFAPPGSTATASPSFLMICSTPAAPWNDSRVTNPAVRSTTTATPISVHFSIGFR